jgi:hypothetical protein
MFHNLIKNIKIAYLISFSSPCAALARQKQAHENVTYRNFFGADKYATIEFNIIHF